MGSFSNYLELELLDHVFKVGAYTQPTHLFVALLKSTPDDADTGSTLPGELSGGGYARVTADSWEIAGAGATSNSAPITFAQATADQGTVTHFAITDHISTGNVIGWGALSASRVISSGDTPRFATNDLDVTLD